MYKIHAKLVFLKKINKKKLNTLKKKKQLNKRIVLFTIFNMNSAISCTVHEQCIILHCSC